MSKTISTILRQPVVQQTIMGIAAGTSTLLIGALSYKHAQTMTDEQKKFAVESAINGLLGAR